MENSNVVGNKLRKLRKAKNYSTQQLADMVNVSQSYISRFENGNAIPNVDMLERILHALETNLSTFFSAEFEEMPQDLLQLIDTVKKLSPEARVKLNEFLKVMVE